MPQNNIFSDISFLSAPSLLPTYIKCCVLVDPVQGFAPELGTTTYKAKIELDQFIDVDLPTPSDGNESH